MVRVNAIRANVSVRVIELSQKPQRPRAGMRLLESLRVITGSS